MLIICTRWDQDETVFFLRWDLTQNFSWDQDNTESFVVFLRDRDKNHFLMKKMIKYGLDFFKTTPPAQDKTETRLSKIKANETRPGQDCFKKGGGNWLILWIRSEVISTNYSIPTVAAQKPEY